MKGRLARVGAFATLLTIASAAVPRAASADAADAGSAAPAPAPAPAAVPSADAGTVDAGPPAVARAGVVGHGADGGNDGTELALGRTLIVELEPGTLDPLLKQSAAEGKEIGLFIDGWYLKGLARPAGSTSDQVRFVLDRTVDNKEAWTRLFNEIPLGEISRKVEVTVGLPNGRTAQKPYAMTLRLFTWGKFWLGLLAAAAVVGLMVTVAFKTRALRDPGLREDPNDLGAWSLGRVQMAWWTTIILLSFVFLWMVTGEAQPFTSSLLALMGIGAGTSLGAALIDEGKRSSASATLEDALAEETRLTAELDALKKAAPPDPTKIAATQASLKMASAHVAEKKAMLKTKNVTFFHDLFHDAHGMSFHRVQMALWTVVLTIIFAAATVSKLAMPDLDATLLALLGISSGTYLGFKLPEKSA